MPTHRFFDNSVNIWQKRTVFKIWEAIQTHDGVNFCLGFLLDFRMQCHRQEYALHSGCCLLIAISDIILKFLVLSLTVLVEPDERMIQESIESSWRTSPFTPPTYIDLNTQFFRKFFLHGPVGIFFVRKAINESCRQAWHSFPILLQNCCMNQVHEPPKNISILLPIDPRHSGKVFQPKLR